MIHENAMAQMLVTAGHKLYFYTRYNEDKHRNDIEIDFLLPEGKASGKIIPAEVKSSKRYRAESLVKFISVYGSRVGKACIIHSKNGMTMVAAIVVTAKKPPDQGSL